MAPLFGYNGPAGVKRYGWLGLLLLVHLAGAQVTPLPNQQLYRGADYWLPVLLAKPDSTLPATAALAYRPEGLSLPDSLQPFLGRVGRSVTLSWTAAQTNNLPAGRLWLEIRVASSVRFAGWLVASKLLPNVPPASPTYSVPTAGASAPATSNTEGGVLRFDSYALALIGLAGRSLPCRVLIRHDEVNNAGGFGKYDYDGFTLIEDLL